PSACRRRSVKSARSRDDRQRARRTSSGTPSPRHGRACPGHLAWDGKAVPDQSGSPGQARWRRQHSGLPMTLRTDHITGAIAIVFGVAVIAMSGELPIGSLSFPGAGLWPKLLAALMIVL